MPLMAVCQGGIQVVRPDFYRVAPHTALLEQAEQAERNGGFATTAAGTRKNERTPGCHTLSCSGGQGIATRMPGPATTHR